MDCASLHHKQPSPHGYHLIEDGDVLVEKLDAFGTHLKGHWLCNPSQKASGPRGMGQGISASLTSQGASMLAVQVVVEQVRLSVRQLFNWTEGGKNLVLRSCAAVVFDFRSERIHPRVWTQPCSCYCRLRVVQQRLLPSRQT